MRYATPPFSRHVLLGLFALGLLHQLMQIQPSAAFTPFQAAPVCKGGVVEAARDRFCRVEADALPPLTLEAEPKGNPGRDQLPSGPPWQPGWGSQDWWQPEWVKRHEAMTTTNRQLGDKLQVVFLGDSLMDDWGDGVKALNPALTIVNDGVGGDSTRQVLWHLRHGLLEGTHPRLVVLSIGTNNLYQDANSGSDGDVAGGVETCVRLLRRQLPTSRILVLGILPREGDWFCDRARRINDLVAKLDNGRTIRVLNSWDTFYDPQSRDPDNRVKPALYRADKVHLKGAGYAAWMAQLKPVFDQLT